MTNNTNITIESIRAILNAKKGRSAWERGVRTYANELIDTLEELLTYDPDVLCNEMALRKAMLNGAKDWSQYSWGGCSLGYNSDIAARLCSPTELKRTARGLHEPNKYESWPDVQARALYQAEMMVLEAYRNA